jgi:propionate CoA-transferase
MLAARKGKTVPVLSLDEAAALIADGNVVTVSASSGLGCPDAMLAAIGERFRTTGAPRGLTTIHPIAAGDMYGIKGIDHLAQKGLLARVIAGSFPSGPSSMEPPAIRRMIDAGEVQAWNLPSGSIFQMHRAGGSRQPGVFSKVGLDTFIDPRREGGALNDVTPHDLVRVEEFGGEEWLFYPAVKPDVAIIRATTSDEHGNLSTEHEGSPLGALDQAYAAHNNGGLVIAQVKRRVKAGSIPPQQVRIPGILVDVVVVVPDQLQTTQTLYDPALSGEILVPNHNGMGLPWGLEKVISRRAASELRRGWVVNLGFGISSSIPLVLLEEHCDEDVTWVIEQGPIGGYPLTGFAFGCAHNPDAIMSSPDQFTLLQGGGFDAACLSFMEIDRHGNVNVSLLPSKTHVSAGVGGFADITSSARRIIFSGYFNAGKRRIEVGDGSMRILEDGSLPKLVPEVAQVTFSGKRALETGQQVVFVTERCVIELRPAGLTVTEVAPGVDLERHVLDAAPIPLQVADDVRTMDSRFFQDEPLGLRLEDG